jgi:hypothetical protein
MSGKIGEKTEREVLAWKNGGGEVEQVSNGDISREKVTKVSGIKEQTNGLYGFVSH